MTDNGFATVDSADVGVVTALLAGFRSEDWSTVRQLLHPGVVWTLPGTSSVSGTKEGVEAVVDTARAINAANLNSRLRDVMVGHSTVVVTLHNSADQPVELDESLALVFEVRDGLVAAVSTHLSDVEGLDRFYAALA